MGKAQRVPKVAHGKVPCIDNNATKLPCERSNKLGGTCACMFPSSNPLLDQRHYNKCNMLFHQTQISPVQPKAFVQLAEDRRDDGNLLHFQNPILVVSNQEWCGCSLFLLSEDHPMETYHLG